MGKNSDKKIKPGSSFNIYFPLDVEPALIEFLNARPFRNKLILKMLTDYAIRASFEQAQHHIIYQNQLMPTTAVASTMQSAIVHSPLTIQPQPIIQSSPIIQPQTMVQFQPTMHQQPMVQSQPTIHQQQSMVQPQPTMHQQQSMVQPQPTMHQQQPIVQSQPVQPIQPILKKVEKKVVPDDPWKWNGVIPDCLKDDW